MIAHKWQPITPLLGKCDYDFSEIDSLQRRWLDIKRERERYDPTAYSTFLDRLTRSWAIETGIIEGLYTLDRGVTETLVMRGISAELIDRNATNKDPHELVAMLDDHQNAAFGVYAEIREGNPITRSAIRQIHAVLTNNQPTFTVADQFGNRFETQLDRGGFKTLPNNPTRIDGTIHEYCPPEHVDSELDNLLAWYNEDLQETRHYHPLLTAAWLHHRFTQMHPFQDGNGRVVRTLICWHLVRENYLPIVIDRDDRPEYIEALERADDGDDIPFVDLLVRIQKKTILDALDELESYSQPAMVGEALDYVVRQVERQKRTLQSDRWTANTVAERLSDHLVGWLGEQATIIADRLERSGCPVSIHAERKDSWFTFGIHPGMDPVSMNEHAGYSVNPREPQFFTELTLTPGLLPRQPKLVFVVFMYHTGQHFTGVMAAITVVIIEHYRYDDGHTFDDAVFLFDEKVYDEEDPFVFTLNDDAEDVGSRLTGWAEQKLARALQSWGERLA